MDKKMYRIARFCLASVVIIFFLSGLLTACRLEGDIEALRKNSGPSVENPAVNPGQPNPEPVPSIPAPGVPVVIASDGILTVRWPGVEEALRYEVYISTTGEPPAVPEKTVSVTTTVLDGLFNKTIYYVWIKAVNEDCASDFSPRARGIPWPSYEAPAAPERPVIIPGINQLTVNWEESGGASSYEVYVNTTPSVPSAPAAETDKTSAVVNNLENDVIYYVWVRAVNNIGKSGYSPLEAGTPRMPTVPPASPPRPVLTAGSREIAVSWQAVELAASYEVWFGTSENSAQAQKYGGDISGTEIVITGLTNEQTYYVWIKAKNVVGTSGFSPSANAKPSAFLVLPETPDMPMVTPGNRELAVSWQPVERTLFYEIWTGVTNNPANAEKHGADISGVSTTLTGLDNGTIYYIWLRGKNNIGIGNFSATATGIPSSFDVAPFAPSSAPSVSAGNTQLFVNWLAVEGAISYEIWIGTTVNQTSAEKYGNDVSSPSGTITGLSNGDTYYVWIKAKNNIGTSGFSPMASGKPIANMGAVTLVPGNGQLTASWSTAAGADQYEVYYSTNNSIPVNPVQTVSTTTATISDLANWTTYYVWVKAKNSIGTSDFSPMTNGTPMGTNNERLPGLYRNNARIGNQNLSASLSYISANAVSGDDFYIVLGADESASPMNLNYSRKTVGITLMGYGGERTITLASNGRLFLIFEGVTLTLDENITLVGLSTNTFPLIGNNGNLIINDGAKISGNTASNSNNGGGIDSSGTFIMNGGTISGNAASSGGGIYTSYGTVTINGGTISGNAASSGGGIYTSYGTVTINGGTISGNTGVGIYISNVTVTINGGTISENTGFGIVVSGNAGNLIMNGGTISENSGGIFVNGVYNGTFTMYDGVISGNTVRGGVELYNGIFTMHGGTISGNTSGGVSFFSSGVRSFTMHGGIISGNIGGGVNHSPLSATGSGIFNKLPPSGGSQNSGIIYGSEAVGNDANGVPLRNGYSVSLTQKRNTTAGQTDYIDTSTGRGLSANGEPPFGE